jgi:hypothetical protein
VHAAVYDPNRLDTEMSTQFINIFDLDQDVAPAIIRQGLIPCSPVKPGYAFTIRALEVYRAVKMHCPQLGIQAFLKSLCDIQCIPIHSYLFQQFSIAYDVYVAILSGVHHQVSAELGHAGSDWCVRNCCPACNYKLEGEPKLLFSQLGAYDGNNSAKRIQCRTRESTGDGNVWTSSEHLDLHDGTAGYFLPRERIDRWEDEATPEPLVQPQIDPDNADENPCAHGGTTWCTIRNRRCGAFLKRLAFLLPYAAQDSVRYY